MIAQNAFQKYQAGRYAEAVDDYKRATEIAPRFASLYRNWAVMEAQEQHMIEADGLLKRASKLNSSDVQIWLTWGNIMRKQGKIKEALSKYQRAYELAPEDGVVLNALGQAKARNGDYKEADTLFREALSKNVVGGSLIQSEIINRTSIARNLVRWAEADRGSRNFGEAEKKLKDALKHCNSAVKLNSTDQKSLELLRKIQRELGYLYRGLNQPLEAANYFSQAIVKKPVKAMRFKEARDTIEASIRSGKIYYELGDFDRAYKIFSTDLKAINDPLRQNQKLKADFDDLWGKMYKRQFGVVKWFDASKGYGFILDEKGQDIFVHYSSIQGGGYHVLLENQRVSFTIGQGKKGSEARDVMVLEQQKAGYR